MTHHAYLKLPITDIQTAADYLPHAEGRLSKEVWQYLQSGTGQGFTSAKNRKVFEDISLMPRPLSDVGGGNTHVELFGQSFDHPVILAPLAYQRLFYPDGEIAAALACVAQGGQMVVSSLASQTLETIIEAAEQALWFQLYWQADRETTLRLVKRAITAGYSAIMFTVDAPVKQAAIALPKDISAVNLEAPIALTQEGTGESVVFDGWMQQAPGWDDLMWLRDQITVPLIIKGILHPDDAERAVSLGCDGVVVSNHGGRVLDGVPGSLQMLPEITRAVSGKAKILFDSGVRNGQDVFKALALGADAVMVGRPYIWGLSTCGALGVAHVIRLMRDELEMTMALSGAKNLQALKSGTYTYSI
jgi:4-hydroxymandelate oxidase